MKTIDSTAAPSASLKFTTSRAISCEGWVKAKTPGTLTIEARLNDECGNGHEDFAVTAILRHPTVRRDCLACGCMHEDVLRLAPEFAPLVALHLCDAEGAPMHAIANAHYWFTGAFPGDFPEIKTKPSEAPEKCLAILQSHLRATVAEIQAIREAGARSKDELAVSLEDLGFRERWKAEAAAGIALLEGWTGKKFQSAATRQNWPPVSPETRAAVKELRESGYYTPEAVEARRLAAIVDKREKRIAAIMAEHDKAAGKLVDSRKVKLYFANRDLSDDNVIFYDHTRTLCFNWSDPQYASFKTKWTRAEFDAFMADLKPEELPAGLKIEFKREY